MTLQCYQYCNCYTIAVNRCHWLKQKNNLKPETLPEDSHAPLDCCSLEHQDWRFGGRGEGWSYLRWNSHTHKKDLDHLTLANSAGVSRWEFVESQFRLLITGYLCGINSWWAYWSQCDCFPVIGIGRQRVGIAVAWGQAEEEATSGVRCDVTLARPCYLSVCPISGSGE